MLVNSQLFKYSLSQKRYIMTFTYISNNTEHNQRSFTYIHQKLICIPTCDYNSIIYLSFSYHYKEAHLLKNKHATVKPLPVWGSPLLASMFPSKPFILAVSSSWWQLQKNSATKSASDLQFYCLYGDVNVYIMF